MFDRHIYDPEQDSAPLRHYVFVGTARRMRRNSFAWGFLLGCVVAGAVGILGAMV
ncbi:MAG: hypothetical protein ACLGIP_16710 [Alphaproteobacteria bacterium]